MIVRNAASRAALQVQRMNVSSLEIIDPDGMDPTCSDGDADHLQTMKEDRVLL